MMMLYEYLGVTSFFNLALVIYPTLLRHHMVPELTFPTLVRIIRDTEHSLYNTDDRTIVARMPNEMWLQVAHDADPANSISLLLALGNRFWRFPGRPSEELEQMLRTWSRRSRK